MNSKLSDAVPYILVVGGALLSFGASFVPPGDSLFFPQAEAIALKTYRGQIASEKLIQEKGRWIFSFDLRGKEKRLHEVILDARTGKVLRQQDETVEQAAQEVAAR